LIDCSKLPHLTEDISDAAGVISL